MVAAFLPLLAASAASLTPQQADLAMLGAFRAACFDVPSFTRIDRAARKAKWVPVAEDAHPNLQLLIGKGREAVKRMAPDAKLSGSQYSGKFGGRTLWLITSRYEDKDGTWSNGCRVYDFEASVPISKDTLVNWMKKPPTGEQPLPDGNTKFLWEPGWALKRSVEVSFVLGTDPISQQFGLKGQVLTAQAIGGF